LHDFYFFEFLVCLFCCCFSLRARIETMSSISESLQCSRRISETVPNPYSFDDYLRATTERKRIKEGCGGSRWQTQPQSTPTFFLPQHLYDLNPFKYAVQESDFLKVHQQNKRLSLSLSLSLYLSELFPFGSFFNGLSVMLVFGFKFQPRYISSFFSMILTMLLCPVEAWNIHAF
jgi:hypothetical protein